MVYAYDQWAQMPVRDLYDTQMMLASVNAAKDMYEKAAQEMKEFKKEYGDFLSPFSKDMAAYENIVGGVQKEINKAFDSGIDLFRSPEGRRIVYKLTNSVDPGYFNAMRANAKLGYAYLDSIQKLRQAGKYSEAQELFDIMQSGGTRFEDFATASGSTGKYNMWDRPSAIQATTLRDLTYQSYKDRTPRTLTKEDFETDPRLRGQVMDPRYEYTGYLDSDLMKVAPGASASLAGDSRAEFFRDQARQKVIASGQPVTEEAVEAQFQRDIANANTWALVDPIRKTDDFAKLDYEYRQKVGLENLRHQHALDELGAKGAGKEDPYSGSYSRVVSNAANAKLVAHKQLMLNEAPENIKEKYIEALSIEDLGQRNKAIQKLDREVFNNYIYKSRPGGSISHRILYLKPGQKGSSTLNEILGLRAVGGYTENDKKYILANNGFTEDSDGWYNIDGGKIVTPHQIMKNILTYESGGISKSIAGLIDRLNTVEKDDDLWIHASTKERAARTKAVKPDTFDGKGYIVAPDENGEKRIYMKVRIKQGATTNIGSWLPQGEHHGFWVELQPGVLPNGTADIESAPYMYGQESQERHDLSNAAVTQSYTDAF